MMVKAWVLAQMRVYTLLVHDRRNAVEFDTFFVQKSSYPKEIVDQIEKAIAFSFDGQKFREVVFFVLALKNGTFKIGGLYTSFKGSS